MSLIQHNDGSESLKNTPSTEEADGDSASNNDELPSKDPQQVLVKKSGKGGEKRHVTFPEDDSKLVTGYMEPVNPWQSVGEVTGSELIDEYRTSCTKHNTIPQQIVLDQLKEYVFLGASRSGNLNLSSHPLLPAQCEALEAVLRRARFNRIDVCNAALTDETAVALFDMLEYYESACELDISCNTSFGILGWQAVSKMVNKSQYLEQLEARGTSLSENTVPVLGRGLRSPCALRVLHLQRAGLRGGAMLCLASALKQNKSVRELHIGDNNLLPEDANHLASLLRCNTYLQLLDISNNDIQDLGVERIADALSEQCTTSPSPSTSTSTSSSSTDDYASSSPQSAHSASYQERGLAVLVMWNNNLTRNSGHHISKALTRCKSLEVLNIGQNPLGGETINRVRVALQQNRSLLCLGVQGARLGPEAGVALAEVIEDNHCIQRIDLRDNKLQTAGLLALATALRKNYSLARLDLDDAPNTHNSGIDQPLEEARLVDEIRTLCKRNEIQQNQPQSTPSTPTSEENLHRRRVASFSTRKISLTCQTLHRTYEPLPEPVLSPPKIPSGRLRSPLPSPIPSPASSPTPSPSHRSRFIVSRVSDSSSITSESSSPSTPPSARSFFANSRFKVFSVQEPPKINVTMAPEEVKVKQQLDNKNNKTSQTDTDLNKNVCDDKTVIKDDNTPDTIKMDEVKSNTNTEERGDIAMKNLENEEKRNVSSNTTNTSLKRHLEETKQDDQVTNVSLKTGQQNEDVFQAPSGIKKNKSESSLDSTDLEVSRLMLKKETYDSSSSLDISGSSMESLNNIQSSVNNNIVAENVENVFQDDSSTLTASNEIEDVFPLNDHKNPFICSSGSEGNPNRKKLSASSNESSLESSAFETGVTVALPQPSGHQNNLLNSSVSSNESVSPNIFGKHMKLHGSVTSLEASVSSLDSYKSKNDFISPQNPSIFSFPTFENSQLTESSDSGIHQSDVKTRTPSFNESFSSNEGTLTSSSNLKSSMFSMGGDSSLSIEEDNEKDILPGRPLGAEIAPRRVTSLLDVPSMQKSPRTRKISWVAPSNFNPAPQPNQPAQQSEKTEDDQSQQSASSANKVPSSLEKLLSLFQHPGSLFSRSDAVEKKSNDSSQSSSRRDSQTSMSSTGSFWPWNISSGSVTVGASKCDNKSPAIGAIERLKKYGESFETALQLHDNSERKADLHSSKSDTYLENKDSENTLTNFRPEKFKEALFMQPRGTKGAVNFDLNVVPQYSDSPPTYSIGAEYLQQTLATCVVHPFQNSNVSADFTMKFVDRVANECTCGKNENIEEVDAIVSAIKSGVLGSENTSEEVLPTNNEAIEKGTQPDILDTEKKLEEIVTTIDSENKEIIILKEDSIPSAGNTNDSNLLVQSAVEVVGSDEKVFDKNTQCSDWLNIVNNYCDTNLAIDTISTSEPSACEEKTTQQPDKVSSEAVSYEMGSVFKFDEMYKGNSETEVTKSSTAVPNLVDNADSTKEKGGSKLIRVLSEGERKNISEIVRNVCEEAVKTVAAKAKRIDASSDFCDKVTSSGVLDSVKDKNKVRKFVNCLSDDASSGADKDIHVACGFSQVQIERRFDCDNSNLSSKEGLCDNNINQCKYLDSDKCLVNNNSNNDIDLKQQTLSRQLKTSQNISTPKHPIQLTLKNEENTSPSIVVDTDSSVLCDNPHLPDSAITNVCALVSNDAIALAQDSFHETNKPFTVAKVRKSNVENKNSFKVLSSLNEKCEDDGLFIPKDFDLKKELIRPTELAVRTTPPKQISIVLKQSIGLDNLTSPNDRQQSPESGPSVSNLPSKIIKRIKENISPENTLTSSMSNTKALAQELMERKNILGANTALWEIGLKENVEKILECKNVQDENKSRYYDELLVEPFNILDEMIRSPPKDQFITTQAIEDFDSCLSTKCDESSSLGDVDQGSDALTVKELISDEALMLVDDIGVDSIVQSALDDDDDESIHDSLTTDLVSDIASECKYKSDKDIEIHDEVTDKDLLSNEVDRNKQVDDKKDVVRLEDNVEMLESIAIHVASDVIIDESNQPIEESETGDDFHDTKINFKPVSILKKATASISKTVSLPQNIPEASKPFPYYGFTLPTPKKSYDGNSSESTSFPTRCGSLPENTTSTLSGEEVMDSLTLIQSRRSANSRSPVQNKLGKMARDSLFALNMTEEEIKEYRSSARLSSMDSVRSLGSLSEDLEGLSSSSYVFQSSSDRESILEQGASQDSLVSLESISENASESVDGENKKKTYDSI